MSTDTAWDKKWRDTRRSYNGRQLRVRWTTHAGDWTARLDGEGRPTHHASREAAQRAAERRAKKGVKS